MSGGIDGSDDEVVIHEANVVPGTEAPRRTGPPRFERATPLPTRIRDGAFEKESLLAGGENIPYGSIKFVALGIIDQMVKDSELKKGPLRKMMSKVVGGEDSSSAKDRAKQTRATYILDLFTDTQDQPYRFEAANINYKSFLDRTGYVSHHNFYRFCVHLARRVPQAIITTSLAGFLTKRRDKVAHFADYHDYELETGQQFRFNRDIVPLEGIDLSSDSWVEEWNEDE